MPVRRCRSFSSQRMRSRSLELKDLQRRTGITFVYVTHDQSEAMALSDRIAVMHGGEIMQLGAPRLVYTRPANKTVADFMRSEEHTSELQSRRDLVCRLLLE